MAAKYRKGDTVIVMTGRDKGKKGEILRVLPAAQRVYVQGVNIVKRHTKQTQTQSGGIVEKEAPIHMSNLAHIDPKTDEPTRVGFKFMADKTKVRYAKRSGEIIDR